MPRYRARFDPKSYLFNTDGIMFDDAGLPVVLTNEHINEYDNIERDGYHDTTDLTWRIDIGFGVAVAKTVISAAAFLAAL